MKYLITLFTMILALNLSAQTITIGDKRIPMQSLQSITSEVAMNGDTLWNADSSDHYRNVFFVLKEDRYIADLDTTVSVIRADTVKLVLSKEMARNIYSQVHNNLTPAARARAIIAEEEELIQRLTPLNSLLVQATGQGYLATTKDRLNARHTGFWEVTYDGATYYFGINGNAAIVQLDKVGDTTFSVKPGGLTGTVRYYNNLDLSLVNLIPGESEVRLGANPADAGRLYKTTAPVDIQMKKLLRATLQ